MMGDKKPVVVAAALMLGVWGISMTRSLPHMKPAEERDTNGPERQNAADVLHAATIPSLEAVPTGVDVRVLASLPSSASRSDAAKPPPPFEFQGELKAYAALHAKVLPSLAEKAAKESLLKNARFLRSLGLRLMEIPLMPLGEQDVAIDLLVEALQFGDKSSAEDAIADIVEDKQVEDVQLPEPVREQLAGIKAEVLYHWTALEPHQGSQVARSLPGPVSRRIWNNVLDAQKNNLAESQAEANR